MQRRSFLKAAAASAFAIPAILGAHAGGAARREELTMEIKRIGSQPSAKGPAEWFTGSVRVDPLFEAPAPARVRGASVTFEPGARTAWHPHPPALRNERRDPGSAPTFNQIGMRVPAS